MIKRWVCLALIMGAVFGFCDHQAQAASHQPQPDRPNATSVRMGETKKVRFYTFGQSMDGRDVSYVDIVVNNVSTSGNPVSANIIPYQWGNFSCSGSYTAYNTLSQAIYKWSTAQSYSISPTLEKVYLLDYTTDYAFDGGWRYRSRSYTNSLNGTSQAYAFSQGNFEYPFVSKKAVILSFTINFMRQCNVSWYESTW